MTMNKIIVPERGSIEEPLVEPWQVLMATAEDSDPLSLSSYWLSISPLPFPPSLK
jgi:hypothetical protein